MSPKHTFISGAWRGKWNLCLRVVHPPSCIFHIVVGIKVGGMHISVFPRYNCLTAKRKLREEFIYVIQI